jgi:uncharacterized lipoprotein YajG
MSSSAVDASASRSLTALAASAALAAGSAPPSTSTCTSPLTVSSNDVHGGATRISSGRRCAATFIARRG